jgi:ribonuclease R
MTPFAIQLTRGFKPSELDTKDIPTYKQLLNLDALEEVDGLTKLKSIYRAGELYINSQNRGYLSSLLKEQKDLLIEQKDLNGAKSGDFVVVKRIIARRGRPSAKVVLIIKHAILTKICISKKIENSINFINIKTAQIEDISKDDIDIKIYKEGTLFKVDALTNKVVDILGHIDDPKVDEKISLNLYNRYDKFPNDAIEQAKNVPSSVDNSDLKDRVDLRHLPFCTIDPVTAKDFDDAIFWDKKSSTLYVAIADVSHYVDYYSPIDKEAIKRGFTTYLPHKAFPMLPRELSENICSLKPHVDRLSFVAKMKIDTATLEVTKTQFIEAVIHSKRRFNYDEIDSFLKGDLEPKNSDEEEIFKYLNPLYELTKRLKAKRLKKGFDFRSQEIKLELDKSHLLKRTIIETGTPSHSLIEECMLLANQSAAKLFSGDGDAIFRIHQPPKEQKIEALLEDLATIGIFIESKSEDVVELIKAIQKEAKKMQLEAEVDELIIQSLKQASYSSFNVGHFGLGFKYYSHFTSPIRRYSDLILHRLIKAQLNNDKEQLEYLLRNIEPLSSRVSELEREATKCEWDFRDRKFARWAKDNIGNIYEAKVIELAKEDSKGATARLLNGAKAATVTLPSKDIELFDKIEVKISDVDLLKPQIMVQKV